MNPGLIVVDGALWFAVLIALLAGLLSFVSPCVLPLVPGYLGLLGGTTTATQQGTASPQRAGRGRLLAGVGLFVLGFTIVFMAVTILGGTLGLLLLEYANVITRILGIVVIVLGLVFIGAFGIAQRTIRPRVRGNISLAGAPLVGIALGIGWTPCIGPTLAAIMSVSWNVGDPGRAGILGLAYSIGLGIPFVILALGLGWASRSVTFVRRHIRAINIAGGITLVTLGLLMVTRVDRAVPKHRALLMLLAQFPADEVRALVRLAVAKARAASARTPRRASIRLRRCTVRSDRVGTGRQ